MAEGDVDAIFGQRVGRAFRPFDQRQRVLRQRRQSDFLQLARIIDAIEIGVNNRKRQIVALRQRECRAWHFQHGIVGEIADHGARRRGLARAEVARERDDIARADQQREVGHQLRRCRLVRQRYRKCRGRCHSAALRCAFWSIGKSQVTVVPLPTTESTRTLPPCSSTKERTSDRPRPAPRCREPWEWLSNQSNTLSFTSAGMPGPESLTVKITRCSVRRALIVTAASCGENPTALASRLYSTCTTRRSSPVKLPMSGSMSTLSSMRSVASRSWIPSAASWIAFSILTGPSSSFMAPASMVARSRML